MNKKRNLKTIVHNKFNKKASFTSKNTEAIEILFFKENDDWNSIEGIQINNNKTHEEPEIIITTANSVKVFNLSELEKLIEKEGEN